MSTAAGARPGDARPTAGAGPGLRDAQSLGKRRGSVSGSRKNPGWDAEPRELRRHRAGRRGGGKSWQEVWKDLHGAAAPAGHPGVVIYPSSLKSLRPPLSLTEEGKRCKVILASGAGTGQSLSRPGPSTPRSAAQKYCMLGIANVEMKPWLSVITYNLGQ